MKALAADRSRSWGLPLALSLSLHGLAVALAWLLTWSPEAGSPGGSGALSVDVVVSAGELLLDPPVRHPQPEPPAPLSVPVRVPDPEPAARTGPPSGPRAEGPPGHGTGAGGGVRTIGLFEVEARGAAVVYVIDRSLSMGLSGALAAAKRELRASLERLPETARVQVILYNRSAEPLRLDGGAALHPATPENKLRLAALAEAVRPEGGTNHALALSRALELRPDTIFFVSDADDLTREQVLTLTRQNQGRTAIHAVELTERPPGRAEGPLPLLARINQGTYQTRSVRP